jgi:hypothetical protein
VYVIITYNAHNVEPDEKGIFFFFKIFIYKGFEDTKGVIRIRKSQKDRKHNGQKKKDKRTNNDLQNRKLKIE